jgi:hypothetical protein
MAKNSRGHQHHRRASDEHPGLLELARVDEAILGLDGETAMTPATTAAVLLATAGIVRSITVNLTVPTGKVLLQSDAEIEDGIEVDAEDGGEWLIL